ncbi:MAG: zinc-dependent alcohol dehydrogenase [Myxococcota bacterium]
MSSVSAISSARALWLTGPERGELREEALAQATDGEVLVRTHFSGVSRGTESLVWRGAVPASEVHTMRCPFQAGEFPFPVKYGYSSVGCVESGPLELRGRLVHCLYPHQSAYVVPASAVIALPEQLPARRAVLAANMETALNALWDARPLIGDRVSVVGAGVLGALVAFLARQLAGVDVELVDRRPARAELAQTLGVSFSEPGLARRHRDVVFHASGNPRALATALELCANDTALIELSWFGDQSVELPLGGSFHSRRLGVCASQVGEVSRNARRRFTHRERRALALELLSEPALDSLIDGECAFEDLPRVMPELVHAESGRLCQLVVYSEQ